ncbi:multi-sensor hybrid histidine kinase [Caldithrix abyssi DSM 13497]|nr:multi-sensor hybrid histidine kinase [Caldithrix abyssi DSM 13497]
MDSQKISQQFNFLKYLSTLSDIFQSNSVEKYIVKNTCYLKWKKLDDFFSGIPAEISPGIKKITGYSAKDFLTGKITFSQLISESHQKRVLTYIKKQLNSGNTSFQNKPYQIKHKNGQWVWIVDFISVFTDTKNRVSEFQCQIIDVTGHIKALRDFSETQQCMILIYEVIANLNRAKSLEEVYEIALKGVKAILKADRASILIFGLDNKVHFVAWDGLSENYRKALDGHCPWEKEDINARPIFISDVKSSNLPEDIKKKVLQEGIKALYFVPLVHPGGLLGKFMVYYDRQTEYSEADEQLVQLLADNLTAIIMRMRALEQASKSEAKYRAIFENSVEGIYQTTYDGKFLAANPSMARILGYDSPQELITQGDARKMYWHLEERDRLINMVLKYGLLKNVEVKLKRKDGIPIWVLMNGRPIYDQQGNFLYFEGAITDITEQKIARDEVKKLSEFQKLILTFATEYINVPIEQFDEKINKALQILGEFTGVDRVYLFDYLFEKGIMTNTHEWCAPGITPQIDNLQKVPINLSPEWLDAHAKGQMVHVPDVNALPPGDPIKKFLEAQEIKTFITVPIMRNGRCIGFAGFDSVKKIRKWSENEITLLKLFAEIISNVRERKAKEEVILRSEEQLRTLINATPDIICFKDEEGRWLEANEADLKLFELQNVEYRGKKDSELAEFAPFYKDAFLTCEISDELAWQKGTITRAEEIVPRPDGTVKIYDVIKVPLFNEDGSRKGLVVFGRDITALKATEKLLERQLHFSNAINHLAKKIISETRREEILKESASLIGRTLGLDQCLIFEINLAAESSQLISQWSNEKTVESIKTNIHPPLEVIKHSASHLIKDQAWLESHANRYHSLLSQENSAKILHDQLKIKSLIWYPISLSASENYLLTLNFFSTTHFWKQEEIGFIRAVVQLIKIALQKIKYMEEQQKSAEQIKRLATLVEQSNTAFIITDKDGIIEYVNPAFEQVTGFKKETVVGQTLPILKSKYRDAILETIGRGQVWKGQWINQRKDGSSFHEEVAIFPIRDSQGNIINLCKSARNIDKEIKLQEQMRQMQKMEAIGQLAGGIAHDFNNLLTVINGYAELTLSRMTENDSRHSALKAILEAGKRAANLTNQLLAFSRKQIVNQELLHLNKVILDTQKMLMRLIGEDIKLELRLQESISPILADRSQIDQILINLVVNARDAVNMAQREKFQKRITIETLQTEYDEEYIRTHPGLHPGKYVVLKVMDNGIGMDRETIEHIFEPFFTTKEKGKGTGLGLSTVYGIVKQNNGAIYVYSEPGLGTTFTVNWPAMELKSVDDEKKKKVNLNFRGKETILLVEDEASVRHFAEKALSNFGFKIHSASNGREALELVKKSNLKPDLLITDLVMPEMNGKELAIKLQKLFPELKVIYVSGYTDDHIVQNGLLEKGIHFVPKPYSVEQLASKIKEVLQT